MKLLSKLIVIAAAVSSVNAFAAYSRIAECTGRSDKNLNATVTLFANQAADTTGIVVVSLQGLPAVISDTQIDWNGQGGYPHFFNNDYDLDIIIRDNSGSVDDILVGDNYIGQLSCVYRP